MSFVPCVGELSVADYQIASLVAGDTTVQTAGIGFLNNAILVEYIDGGNGGIGHCSRVKNVALAVNIELAVHTEALTHIVDRNVSGQRTSVIHLPDLLQTNAIDGLGLSRNDQLELSGLADNLTLALSGSGDGVLNVLGTTCDGVGVGNEFAVYIQQNLAITGSGDDGLVLIHGVGDFGSLGDGLQVNLNSPLEPLLVVTVVQNRATALVSTGSAAGFEDDFAALEAFLDNETEQKHLLVFTSFPLHGTVRNPSTGVLAVGVLPVAFGADSTQEVFPRLIST